jgi:hypothetical protein
MVLPLLKSSSMDVILLHSSLSFQDMLALLPIEHSLYDYCSAIVPIYFYAIEFACPLRASKTYKSKTYLVIRHSFGLAISFGSIFLIMMHAPLPPPPRRL